MSCWTYVTGVIEVDTCARSDAEAMYLAQTVVNHLARKEAQSCTCHNRMVTVRRATLTNLTNPVIFTMTDISGCSLLRTEF